MEYEKIVQNVEEKMLNNKNEVVSVLPIRNFNGGYMKKTYKELIEDISPDEIDELYCFLDELKEKNVSKDAEVKG
jgi:hypothetical protein